MVPEISKLSLLANNLINAPLFLITLKKKFFKSKFTSYNLHINILNVVWMHVAIVLYFPEIFGEKGMSEVQQYKRQVKTKWMEH